ncbi:MAG TPA: hypothetical protein VHC69_13525 [Polyangiaceae bacterium]|nr:hypothetical protein [Polyangiaceae bacterium]
MSGSRRTWRALAGISTIAVAGCAGGGRPETPPATPIVLPATTVAVAPSATPPVAPKDDHATAAIIADALREASKIRELPATSPVRGVALSRAEMAAHVEATIEREVPAEAVADEGEVLVALGVAPPGFDYMRATVSMMSAELAGYYEPSEKTMYLAADLGRAERGATLSHELVHALQDQHYDLGKLLEYHADASDQQSAVHALAEGDATSAMLDEMLAPKGAKATDLSDELIGVQVRAAAQFTAHAGDIPDILRRSMIAPYVDGILFVHWLRRRGGWAAVDDAWKNLPVSTEQLLHPDKYLAREAPIVVPVPVVPPGTWEVPKYSDVMGEQSVRLLLEEWLPRIPAASAASGWGGDRIVVFRSGARVAVGWHLRYDDAAVAARLAAALLRGVAAQPGTQRASLHCVERPSVGPLLVAHRDRDVAVVAGPYDRADGVGKSAGTCQQAAAWAGSVLAQH